MHIPEDRSMDTQQTAIRLAYERLDRRLFLDTLQDMAAIDGPLPIGYGQTISQPSLVLQMTQWLEPFETCRVLEIGTGSGYQTALLAGVCSRVYTVERIEPLHQRAKERLALLGYSNISLRLGDGWQGWPEEAPFDRIIVTAAARELPEALTEQLNPGGVMIIPLGREGAIQELVRVRKDTDGLLKTEVLEYVRFVPLVRD
jgi:protein-L-isoaspartate(D-aspartate) O-methyltransferase